MQMLMLPWQNWPYNSAIQIVKAHRVIPINCALESLRKDHLQVPVPAR
jgi:hypothetical protein